MTLNSRKFAALLPFLACSVSANQAAEQEESSTMLGLLAISSNSIYVEGEDQTRAIPFFSGQWGNVYLEGASLGYILAKTERSVFSIAVELDSVFVDERDDSPALADMRELDSAFTASLNYEYESDFGELGLSFGADASGTHDGYKASISYGVPFMAGPVMITPSVSVQWVSEEINDFYYGVTAEDVKEGRPLYTPDAGINYSVGVSGFYFLAEQHSIMFFASYDRYDDEVFNSPIVDEQSATTLGLGYVYRF